ncbi:SWIM-type domain-containing protein [Citrus sinensis]|nr:SWIM-type domain-containing protein [Citrus sinensis]
MDGDDDTTMFVTYKDKTHNLGIVDRDKFSRVSVINKVMVRVYGRKMLFDERFNMSIWQPWDCKKAQIDTDTDLISQLKEHNHHLIYYMQLYLDKIPQNHDSTAKRVLFESFKPNSSRDPDTNNPATLNLNDPIPLPLHVSTNPTEFSNEKLLHELEATIPIIVTTNIMKSLVASDSIQSQSNSQKSPLHSITKIQNKIDANSNLFEDFMDTYFRSPTQNQTTIRTQTEAVTQTQTSDAEHTDEVSDNNGDNTSCYTLESPSQQLPQNFTQSRNLSPLLNDCPSSHEETNKASEAAFTSLDQNDMVSFLQTQNPESQPIFASNPFNNSSDHGNILNSKAAVGAEYDLDDNVFSLIDSDEDPEHPFGTPNVIKPPTKTVLEYEMACVVSDDSDGDYILSDYKSGDDDCGLVFDDEGDGVLAKMEAVIRENLYIPSWDPVTFRIWMYFRNFRELAWAIRQHAVKNKFKVYRHKFERARITVGCAYYKCPWFLHAGRTRFGGVYLLKRLHNVHTCSRELDNPECTAEFITVKYEQTFLDHPDTKVDFIIDELRRIYSCKVNRFKVYRAKKMALQRAGADHESSYRLIRSYAQIILNKMPQALALVSVIRFPGEQSQTHFDRFILSFPALRDGFKAGCRPFIGIDDCHLKGPYKGVMLSAVALDANTGIFPVVVCVCSVESTSTWTWFLGHLKTFLEDARQLTFMCDRQKGIQNALALEFPNAHVRFCARHILANLKTKHPHTNFKAYFWAAARACNCRDFDVAMTNLKNIDEGVYETLRRLPPKFWAKHAFDNSSSGRPKMNRRREADEVPPEKKRYRMQCLQDRLVGPLSSALGRGSTTVIHMQPYEHVRTTVEVHEPREMQLPPQKTNAFRNQEGPSGTKKMNPQQMANIEVNAPWLGVQGRKIMAVGGISLRKNQTTKKKSELNNIGKGKAPAFPPEMVVNSVAGGASSDTSSNASGYASSWA